MFTMTRMDGTFTYFTLFLTLFAENVVTLFKVPIQYSLITIHTTLLLRVAILLHDFTKGLL